MKDTYTMDRDGTIAIQNGKIKITDPVGLGRYPRLKPGNNIRLFIAGEEVAEEVVVSETLQDKIEIRFKEPAAENLFKLKVTEDQMEAYLKIEGMPGADFVLKDSEPVNQLTITAEVIKQKALSVTATDIIEFLNARGIIYGLNPEGLAEVILSEGNKWALVAKGQPCIPGVDARVKIAPSYQKYEKKDFFNIHSFEPGDIVAYKEEAIPGRVGINIRGEKIQPLPLKDITLKAGKGVIISPDGLKAIARQSGRVNLKRYNNIVEVSIIPEYIVKGNVDKNTGNLNYQGDLIITGDVNDYFKVKAGHNLKVGGNIANAHLNVGGNLLVRHNIIASTINLGNYINYNLLEMIKKVCRGLKRLLTALEQISGEVTRRYTCSGNFQVGKIIRLLIVNKFEYLPLQLKNIYQVIDDEDNPDLKREFKKVMQYINNPIRLERLQNELVFVSFLKYLENIIEEQEKSNHQFNVAAGYVQNSKINVVGDVIITKKGCINSRIAAKGSIIIKNRSGYIKGGSYKAGNLIYSPVIGTRLSITTIEAGNRVYIGKSIGPLKIIAPHEVLEIDTGASCLNYRINSQGKFEVETRKPDIEEMLSSGPVAQ